MRYILKKNNLLFFLFIIFLPFTSLSFLKTIFKGYALNLSLYPFLLELIILTLFSIKKQKIFWIKQTSSSQLMLLFLLFFLWASINSLLVAVYLNHIGIEAYGKNPILYSLPRIIALLILFLFIYYITYKINSEKKLYNTKKVIYISLAFIIFYGYFQIFSLYFPNSIYNSIASIIDNEWGAIHFNTSYVNDIGRLNLTTMEASHAGMLLQLLFLPFLLSAFVSKQKIFKLVNNKLMIITIIPLFIFTFSSSTYISFILQIIIFFVFIYKKRIKYFYLLLLLISSLFLFFTLSEETLNQLYYLVVDKSTSIDSSGSSQTRFGLLYASYLIFLDFPLTGIGTGGELFVIKDYVPTWAYNYEITESITQGTALGPKAFFPKILTEYGIFVTLLFIYILIKMINSLRKIKKIALNDSEFNFWYLVSINIIIAFILRGITSSGHLFLLYFWFVLALVISVINIYGRKYKHVI